MGCSSGSSAANDGSDPEHGVGGGQQMQQAQAAADSAQVLAQIGGEAATCECGSVAELCCPVC